MVKMGDNGFGALHQKWCSATARLKQIMKLRRFESAAYETTSFWVCCLLNYVVLVIRED